MTWIQKCFASLINSSLPLHIIAIDNASTDNSCAFIKENFNAVELIETICNLGFGKANNIGLRKAIKEKADYVFLLNQDAWVENDCIEKLVIFFEQNKNFSLLSPFHFNYDEAGLEFYFEEYVLKQYTKGFSFNSTSSQDCSKAYETEFVHAAAWLLPIETITKIGGFDPLFTHTGEDNDFIQRLQFKGMKAGILSTSKVYHKGTNAGLKDVKNNYSQILNNVLLKLKNPSASIIGAFWLYYRWALINYIKNIFRKKCLITILQKKILIHIILNSLKIISSRKLQIDSKSYL